MVNFGGRVDTRGACVCVICASLCGPLQLDVIFCFHLVFLAEEMAHRQVQNLCNVQTVV